MSKAFITRYKEKAQRNMATAAKLRDHDDAVLTTINRAYYAVFQASCAWMKAHEKNYPPILPGRNAWEHKVVLDSWEQILQELHQQGVEPDLQGYGTYKNLKDLRTLVDYEVLAVPPLKDAQAAVDDAAYAVTWLLSGLRKVGY